MNCIFCRVGIDTRFRAIPYPWFKIRISKEVATQWSIPYHPYLYTGLHATNKKSTLAMKVLPISMSKPEVVYSSTTSKATTPGTSL